MTRNATIFAIAVALLHTAGLLAQPHGEVKPGENVSEVRLQYLSFDNFFNVSGPGAQTVNGIEAEYRGAHGLSSEPVEIYWHVNFLDYDQSGLKSAYGGRVGASHAGPVQEYNVYLDSVKNRPASDLRNGGTADRTTLFAEYGYQFTPAWQVIARGSHEDEKIKGNSNRDNTFNGVEGLVRYHGFGWRVTPQVGAAYGKRDVRGDTESYNTHGWIAGVEWIPVDRLYLSAAYRSDKRDFSSFSPVSRDETHGIIELIGDVLITKRVHGILYYEHEAASSPLPSSDYDTGILIVGASYRF